MRIDKGCFKSRTSFSCKPLCASLDADRANHEMNIITEIKTIEHAKKYFVSMGCSHFHMGRENFELYKDYRSLKISSETESLWRQDEFDRQLLDFQNIEKEKYGLAFFCLTDLIETNDYYLTKIFDLTDSIIDKISGKQISNLLTSIIGNDSTKTHGGLIQKSNSVNRQDIRDGFISIVLALIDKAENESVEITFLRGNIADIIDYYKITDLSDTAAILRTKDDIDSLKYYENGANEGNIFSMNMLAKYFREGRGCKIDIDKAKYWERKSKQAST